MKNGIFGKAAVLFLVLLAAVRGSAQEIAAPNSIYLELVGNGIIYSINYDRMFSDDIGGRIGFTFFPALPGIFTVTNNIFIMPATLNFFIGEGDHKLELGAGIVYARVTLSDFFTDKKENASGLAETVTIGYRYQQRNGGFLFRIGFTPLFMFGGGFAPLGGISFGTSF